MCFKKWLVSNFKNERGPIGDLARDVKDDKDFPARAQASPDYRRISGKLRSLLWLYECL